MNAISHWQKHGKTMIHFFIVLAALYAGFLLYRYYLKPSYELAQFLPENYQISFEYKNDRFTFPALQQKRILDNPLLKSVYDEAAKKLDQEVSRLPQAGRELLKKSEYLIVFWQNNDHYGLIAELADQSDGQRAEAADFSPWQNQVFKKQILLLASTKGLLDQMTSQKIKAGRPAYLSLTISPWLTVKFKSSFFQEQYDDSILNSLQTVLTPLKNSPVANFRLEVDSDPYALITRLIPKTSLPATSTTAGLKNFFSYLPKNSQLVIGLADLKEIPEQLQNNPDFKAIWTELDNKLWLGQQISLSGLLKNAQVPIVLSWSNDLWQIATVLKNRDLAEYYLKNFLGQFEPKERVKALPDGSQAVELLASPEKIIWQTSQLDGWTILTYPKNQQYRDLGMAIKNQTLLIGNKIGQNPEKGFNLNCSVTPKIWENQPIKALFWLNPQVYWLKLAENLKKFNKILFTQYASGEMTMCLGLK